MNTQTTAMSVEKSAVWRHMMRSDILTLSRSKYPITIMPQSVPRSPSATFSWSDPAKNGNVSARIRLPRSIPQSDTAIEMHPRAGISVVTAE